MIIIPSAPPQIQNRAFSLVEVTLALGLAAFSLVSLLGLIPLGLTNNKASVEETAAAGVLATIVANLRSAQPNNVYLNGIYPVYGVNVVAVPPNPNFGQTIYVHEDGTLAGQPNHAADPSTNPRFRVTIQFYPPPTPFPAGNGSDLRQATVVRLTINWPAIAEANNYTPVPSYANSLEVVTTLDRN